MNEIPRVIEELYYQMAHIPPKDAWPEITLTMREEEVEKLYMFYEGFRLGVQLTDAGRKP